LSALKRLSLIYLLMAFFWALYEQTGSSWVLQAENIHMIKNVSLFGWKFEILPAAVQAANPFFVILLVPLFAYVIYPLIDKFFKLTPLRKMSIGMFLVIVSFIIVGVMEVALDAGTDVSILWQLFAYLILTMSEVMVYGTGLEFAYTQAPNSMKSLMMGFFLLSISLGNALTAFINYFIENDDHTSKLAGASYWWFFSGMMFVVAIAFIFVAYHYKEKTYVRAS
jgi:POT family proton-dependent oligopeptide transporter